MHASAASRIIAVANDEPIEGWTLPPRDFASALGRAGVPLVHQQRSGVARALYRALARAGLLRPISASRGVCIAPIAWANVGPAYPAAFRRELVPWIFDCWGPQFPAWERALRSQRCRLAFFSARAAADHFRNVIPGLDCRWLPEACDPARYSPGTPLHQRAIHVLELGRKHEPVHNAIRGPLEQAGKKHIYSLDGANTVLFSGVEALYAGLGDTAVALCYPKTVTHPAAAGGVETLTQRYFEVMGSGALAVGVSPAELRDLFGFDPVIPIDMRDPAGQLLEILANLHAHQAHADRCRARLLEVGTFDSRARDLLRVLSERP